MKWIVRNDAKWEMMLKLSEFSHNHHPSRVKMLAVFIGRGIWVIKKLKTKRKISCPHPSTNVPQNFCRS
jgi:hypothetical protein